MHQLYFVAIKENNQDNKTAMSEAEELLNVNNFCSSEGGYFSSHKGDWYEVGGRWADFLCNTHKWAQEAHKEIEAYLKRPENMRQPSGKGKDTKPEIYSIRGTHYGSDEEKTKQAELRERCELIWGKHRPPEYPKVPYDRWHSEGGIFSEHEHKRDDCAVLLTDELVEYLREHTKKDDKKDSLAYGFDGLEIFVQEEVESTWGEEWKLRDWIMEIDKNPSEYIGKYWIVTIDYHS